MPSSRKDDIHVAPIADTPPAKPAVLIFAVPPLPEETVAPILWGLEEEGIPVEVREAEPGSAESLAKTAADASVLHVGIGIRGGIGGVVLHHRDLPADQPLVRLGAAECTAGSLRRLGANAARLVKGDPLRFEAEGNPGDGVDGLTGPFGDNVVELIARIVIETLART
jgi:hypothetical protein